MYKSRRYLFNMEHALAVAVFLFSHHHIHFGTPIATPVVYYRFLPSPLPPSRYNRCEMRERPKHLVTCIFLATPDFRNRPSYRLTKMRS